MKKRKESKKIKDRINLNQQVRFDTTFLLSYPLLTDEENEQEFGIETLSALNMKEIEALNRLKIDYSIFEMADGIETSISMLSVKHINLCVNVMVNLDDKEEWTRNLKELEKIVEEDVEFELQQSILSLLQFLGFKNLERPYTTIFVYSFLDDVIVIARRPLNGMEINEGLEPRVFKENNSKDDIVRWYNVYKTKCNFCNLFAYDLGIKKFRRRIRKREGVKLFERLMTCGSCKKVYYCSTNCQGKDWKMRHKKECKLFSRMSHSDVQVFIEENHKKERFLGKTITCLYSANYLLESKRKTGEKIMFLSPGEDLEKKE